MAGKHDRDARPPCGRRYEFVRTRANTEPNRAAGVYRSAGTEILSPRIRGTTLRLPARFVVRADFNPARNGGLMESHALYFTRWRVSPQADLQITVPMVVRVPSPPSTAASKCDPSARSTYRKARGNRPLGQAAGSAIQQLPAAPRHGVQVKNKRSPRGVGMTPSIFIP